MIWVLDADILSLLRRPERMPQLAARRDRIDDAPLFTTVVTPGEIERGIHRRRRIDARFAEAMSGWARGIARSFGDRILDFAAAAAQVRGRLTVERGYEDADLAPTGVRHVNPRAG